MKSDKEMSDCLLENILVDVAERIVSSAKENSHFEVVYRVAKWGKIEEKAFWNTYGEIQSGIIPDSDVKYPKDDIGTYLTSVYDQQKSCDKYIRCLKRSIRLKKVYPRPVVIRGKTSNGLVQRTIEREQEYNDPTHIDWWIYKGKTPDVMKEFVLCEEG